MPQQQTPNSPQPAAEEQASVVDEQPKPESGEKRVPVSEAIRYRKRAQAAEKELSELKQNHQQQADELKTLEEQVQQLQQTVDQNLTAAAQNDNTHKTQGVKESRTDSARTTLQTAARQAAASGSRADVHQYLRLRRSYL